VDGLLSEIDVPGVMPREACDGWSQMYIPGVVSPTHSRIQLVEEGKDVRAGVDGG